MGALRVTVARYAETIHVLCAPRGVLGAALCSCLWVGGKGPSVDRSNMRDVWGSVLRCAEGIEIEGATALKRANPLPSRQLAIAAIARATASASEYSLCVSCRRWWCAAERGGVDIPDLVEALGELPAGRRAPITVVVDTVGLVRAAVAKAPEQSLRKQDQPGGERTVAGLVLVRAPPRAGRGRARRVAPWGRADRAAAPSDRDAPSRVLGSPIRVGSADGTIRTPW